MPFTLLDPDDLEWEALNTEIEEYSIDIAKALDEGQKVVSDYINESVGKVVRGIFEFIMVELKKASHDIGVLVGYVAQGYERGLQDSRKLEPITLMAQGDLLELLRRGLLDDKYFADQLARTGLDTEAINNLKNLIRNLLNPADITSGFYRGTLDPEKAKKAFQDIGYNDTDAGTLIDNASQLIDVERVLDAMLRGEITDTETSTRLKSIGYKDDSIALLKKLALYIPPVEDLITMSVREVFSPDIASKFGQFEDFPDDFKRYAQMKGVSEEWAQRYWAAHWRLPSAEMGYEMLHRNVIDGEELNMLLRALDIMPFWRDKMVKISYRPYTRVDVRRMHKVGVLEEEDVERAYLDIGYDKEKAEKMKDFTIAYNEGKEKTLHKGELTKLYLEHVIKRDDYVKELIGLGIAKKSAGYIADLADIQIEKKVLNEQIRSIGILYVEGLVSESDAHKNLGALGQSTEQILRLFDIWNAKKASKYKHLSIEQLDKLLKSDLIELQDYLARVQILGYSAKDAELLSKLVLKQEVKSVKKPTE